MKKYNSKIGLEIVIPLIILLGGTIIIEIMVHAWFGVVINLLVAGFITYVFITTLYLVDGNQLIIKCGFLVNMTINIESIVKIAETNNPMSSPAASLDRIEIYYNNRSSSVMISPKDKKGFISQLTSINSKIEVVLKKKQAGR